MTNKEILKKAIEKANQNRSQEDIENRNCFYVPDVIEIYNVIFCHDFAKAFFG